MKRPLFEFRTLGTCPDYISGNSSWIEHIPFGMFLIELANPRRVVELGVFHGVSYCAFCQAVSLLGLPTQCSGVDTWEGDGHAGELSEKAYFDLKRRHDPRFGTFSQLLRMTFDAASAQIENGTVDLLYIDGFHTYEAVKHDFENWLEKMSDRGIVLFHDTQVQGYGVGKLWSEVSENHPSFEFHHGCGLGVLFLGDSVTQDQDVKEFMDYANASPEPVRNFFLNLGMLVRQRTTLEQVRGSRGWQLLERVRRVRAWLGA